MPRLRFLRPSTGLGLEKRGIHPPIWPFIGRFYYLRLFAWLLPALISASLKQHRHKLYQELVSTGKLQAHLLDINDTANDWLDRIMPQMAKAAGATEELKSRDQMAWVGLMNNCKANAHVR